MKQNLANWVNGLALMTGCSAMLVAATTPSAAMRTCKFGYFDHGDRCLHKSGKAICQFSHYGTEGDPSSFLKCWDRKGVRLYIRKNAKDGKYYLTYGKGGRRGRKRDPRF